MNLTRSELFFDLSPFHKQNDPALGKVFVGGNVRASFRFEKKTDFLDKSWKIIDILPVFFGPKWSPR